MDGQSVFALDSPPNRQSLCWRIIGRKRPIRQAALSLSGGIAACVVDPVFGQIRQVPTITLFCIIILS